MKKIFMSFLAMGLTLCVSFVNVQAQKKTVNIITKVKVKYHGYSSAPNGTKMTTYHYNRNGLIDQLNGNKYIYNSNGHLRQIKVRDDVLNASLNRMGLVTKLTYQHGGDQMTFRYNKQGLMSSRGSVKYTYNRKNQLKKSNEGVTYQYNKQGYVSSTAFKMDHRKVMTYCTYKFEKGRVHQLTAYAYKKRSQYYMMNTYQYKRITVNAKYANEIRHQQDALLSKNGYQMAYMNGPLLWGAITHK